jgi:hypothetical protein
LFGLIFVRNMSADSSSAASVQRRQFGRRDGSRPAYATLPGGTPIACTVSNLSEGGALVEFAGASIPTRNFRLSVDGAPYTMICEIRHQAATSVGVRFVNLTDGARLMAHLYPGPVVTGTTGDSPHAMREDQASQTALNTRDLRQKVLASLAERATQPPVSSKPAHQRLLETIRSGLAWLAYKATAEAVSHGVHSTHLPSDGDGRIADPEPPISAPAPRVEATVPPLGSADNAIRGYQPKRSRRKGIKGRSAGGIG